MKWIALTIASVVLIVTRTKGATLYFKSNTTNGWSVTTNWWQDSAATIQATNYPWEKGTFPSYQDHDLRLADDATVSPKITGGLWFDGTGVCYIPNLTNTGSIYNGRFAGSNFVNSGEIDGGIFLGANFRNETNGIINNGIFGGMSFTNVGKVRNGMWWDKGAMKFNSVILRPSGAANPDTSIFPRTIRISGTLGGGMQ